MGTLQGAFTFDTPLCYLITICDSKMCVKFFCLQRSIGSDVREYLPSDSFNDPIEMASMYDSRFLLFFRAASCADKLALGGGPWRPYGSWPETPDAAEDGRAWPEADEADRPVGWIVTKSAGLRDSVEPCRDLGAPFIPAGTETVNFSPCILS